MKNAIAITLILICMIGVAIFINCTKDNPIYNDNTGKQTIRLECAFDKNSALSEASNAVAILKGVEIIDSIVTEILVDNNTIPKYGIVELPQNGSNWSITIWMFDAQRRKIGEGLFLVDSTCFKSGKTTASITIEIYFSQLTIDKCAVQPLFVGIKDSIVLYGIATSHYKDGKIAKYEWKFGSAPWIITSGVDTNILAPVTAQAYAHLAYVQGDFPVAESIHSQILSLPLGPHLTENDQDRVIAAVFEAVNC
jgi:hypothetical protein